MPKPGETCQRCGQRIRLALVDDSTLADAGDRTQQNLSCDCLAGPLGPDDED